MRELHKNYPLASDRIEIKREMLSEYQLKIADLYSFPIGNVKKLVPIFFLSRKVGGSLWKHYLRLRLELKT